MSPRRLRLSSKSPSTPTRPCGACAPRAPGASSPTPRCRSAGRREASYRWLQLHSPATVLPIDLAVLLCHVEVSPAPAQMSLPAKRNRNTWMF
eukprot:6214357-Pleurochrysis_carterae.AAC.2